MPMKFSVDSIEYFAEKFTNTPSLSYESLGYLSSQISEVISQLLQVDQFVDERCSRCYFFVGCIQNSTKMSSKMFDYR